MDDRTLRRIGTVLVVADLALVALYVTYMMAGVQHWLPRALLDLDGEATLPAWYGSSQLLLAGVVFGLAAARRASPEVSPGFLATIGAGFVFLSADEAAGIHESVTRLLRDGPPLPAFAGGHGIWIPIYLAIGLAFVAGTAPRWLTLRRIAPRGSAWLVGGALLFLTGAVGLEILSYDEPGAPVTRLWFTAQVAAEECLELLGATAMLVGSALIERSVGARG